MGGAFFSGTSMENIEKLGRYGYGLGMAFQIVDDCLDLIGETETLGKTAGLDVYKNEVTLPLLYLFSELGESDGRALLSQVQTGEKTAYEKIKKLAVEKKAVHRAMLKAREYTEGALEELTGLADSPCKESLRLLTDYCLERVK